MKSIDQRSRDWDAATAHGPSGPSPAWPPSVDCRDPDDSAPDGRDKRFRDDLPEVPLTDWMM
jgi:hypothetical protein